MKQFLLDELFSMTLAATVQRSPTYKKEASEIEKAAFRSALQKALTTLTVQYRKVVPEDTHCQNIQALAKELSSKHGKALYENRFRIGSAQKSLNLYLKYMWCLDMVASPPHCPIDSVVLDEIRKKTGYKSVGWTKLNSIGDYKEIISHAKAVAGQLSLSDWELQLYNQSSA